MEQERRSVIVEIYGVGHDPAAIYKLLNYPRLTVYDDCKKFDKRGTSQRKEHEPRSDKIRTPRFVAGLKRSLEVNPGTPMSKLAKNHGVHRTTICKAIK